MRFSKEWILREFTDNAPDNEEELVSAMGALGHQVQLHADYWEINSPAHRPDCRSVAGVAREICAALGIPFRYEALTVEGCEDISIFDMLDVDVWDDRLCNRLTCRMVCNLSNSPTPHWMQQRLTDCGITPAGGIEDIANYVELELGQPLLLLDQRCCSGSLTLRAPFPGECEEDIPVLAGDFQPIVTGNAICDDEARVKLDTDTVILCAIHDSCHWVDSITTYTAVQRMCQLIQQLQMGTVADGTIDILNFIPFEVKISGSIQQLNQDLNAAFTETELTSLLQPTGITLVKDEFLIPPHRTDLTLWEHILKEISRIQSARRK